MSEPNKGAQRLSKQSQATRDSFTRAISELKSVSMCNEVVTVLLSWISDSPRSQQAAEIYARVRQLCKFEPIKEFEKISAAYLNLGASCNFDHPLSWPMMTMLLFNLEVSAARWIPQKRDNYIRGRGDELLGMRWSGDGTVRLHVWHPNEPEKTFELSEPFELQYPWSTGWKHGSSGTCLIVSDPLPPDLEVKWCLVDQRKSLEEAKGLHKQRFRASLDTIKARNV